MSILNQINGHDDLKGLHADQRVALCADIREAIINVVETNGGHLSSNLGVVELTVALYTVFDPIRDVIIWDVGHQTYAHKLLTGRQSAFNTLRKKDGLSGFPKTRESEADGFVAGHASNSVSAALGLARARDLKKEEHRIVAVIGDGALTGGMAYEALNDAGQSESDLLVILNDNAMSISDNVGGVNNMLSRMRTRPGYLRFKTRVKKTLQHVPMVGRPIMRFAAAVRDKIKFFVLPRRFFEEIGFTYIGPMDGHDTEGLIEVFSDAAKFKGPLFLHLITKKGKGMQNAELDPIKFHSVSVVSGTKAVSNSAVVGNVLIDIAAEDARVVAITAAMKTGTGLQDFARLYPDRFFDVGIAEQHAVTLAAGMAAGGLRPYAAIYATFLQRAYDQILQDVCLPCLPMCFCVDRAGLVGEDGETHHGLFDIAMFSAMPNMRVYAPSTQKDLAELIAYARELSMPCAIRYPRGSLPQTAEPAELSTGAELCVVAVGRMAQLGRKLQAYFKAHGESVALINEMQIKPLPEGMADKLAQFKWVVTLEEGMEESGFGASISRRMSEKGNTRVLTVGVPEWFVPHAKVEEQFVMLGWTETGLYERICKWREGMNNGWKAQD